jgi:hypothetical protein
MFARVFVDPEVLETVVCGAGIGVHLKVLRTTEYRPVHRDRGFWENDFGDLVSE